MVNNKSNSAMPTDIVRYAHTRDFQAVVYDEFSGSPLMVTFLGNQWWVTTPGEKLQPLEEYFEGEDIGFRFLCEANGKVGALALAKMIGKAAEEPEDDVRKVMRQRVECLKRLGVKLEVKDESLALEMKVFSNEDTHFRQGKFSMWCHATANCYELLFDIDGFGSREDAEEWAGCYLDILEELGINFNII